MLAAGVVSTLAAGWITVIPSSEVQMIERRYNPTALAGTSAEGLDEFARR